MNVLFYQPRLAFGGSDKRGYFSKNHQSLLKSHQSSVFMIVGIIEYSYVLLACSLLLSCKQHWTYYCYFVRGNNNPLWIIQIILTLIFKQVNAGLLFPKRVNYEALSQMFTNKSRKSQIHIHVLSGYISSFYLCGNLMIQTNFTMTHLTLPPLPFCSQCPEYEQPAVWLPHAVAGALVDWQPVPAVCLRYLCSSCQPSWPQCPVHQRGRVCLWSVQFLFFFPFSFHFLYCSQSDPVPVVSSELNLKLLASSGKEHWVLFLSSTW